MKKRVLSLFLSVILILTTFAVPTFAISLEESGTDVTIYFYVDGTKWKTIEQTIYDGDVTLPTPSKSGEEFSHWVINGTSYEGGAEFKMPTKSQSGGYTYKATCVWKSDATSTTDHGDITANFDSGASDATGTQKSITAENGEELKFPSCTFERKGYTFAGWKVGSETYAAGDVGEFSVGASGSFTATALWTLSKVTITYKGGEGVTASDVTETYDYGSTFTLSKNQFTRSGYAFNGWSVGGTVYKVGTSFTANSNMTATATWVVYTPSSSVSSVASVSSVSSVSETSSESESEEEVTEETAEEPVEEVFEPVTIAYSISGDVPVSGIEFTLDSDIGGTPSLLVSALDAYSSSDSSTSRFISSGDAIAAFDLSLLCDGTTYHGQSDGTVKFTLNGTQTTYQSSYDEYVLAIVHNISRDSFTGSSYYMSDGKTAYLYDISTGNRSETEVISFTYEDGFYKPVLRDIDSLSSFAYLSSDGIISEVKILPDSAAESVSIDVSSLSPFLLVQMQVGSSKAKGSIPTWVWIIIAVVVILMSATVALYLFNRSNERKEAEARKRRVKSVSSNNVSHSSESHITGFDDDDDDF